MNNRWGRSRRNHQFPRILSLGRQVGNNFPSTGNISCPLYVSHLQPFAPNPFDGNTWPNNLRNSLCIGQTDPQSHLSCSKQCCSRLQVNSRQLSSLKDKGIMQDMIWHIKRKVGHQWKCGADVKILEVSTT